jgi:lysophospholipase L1-like esterase
MSGRNTYLSFLFSSLGLLLSSCGIYYPQEINTSGFENGKGGKGPALTVIGDSQSTGVLASTAMGEEPPGKIISSLLSFFYSNDPSMENLQEHFSEYRNSALASDESWGLRARIASTHHLTVKDIPLYLAAKWGGKVRDVPGLLGSLNQTYAQTGKKPAYVVVMLGANDLCNGESSALFEEHFAQALQLIAAAHPDSRFLIAAIPPLPQLLAYDHHYNATINCTQVRERFCPAIFADDFAEHYVAYNAAIERVVKQFRDDKHLNLVFVDGFRSMYFESQMLAFDCFHPSLAAQKQYAGFFTEAFSGLALRN